MLAGSLHLAGRAPGAHQAGSARLGACSCPPSRPVARTAGPHPAKRQRTGALPETWVDDTADDGEALCTSGDLSQQAVEHVRWSNAQLRQIDVDWEDEEFQQEQQAFQSGDKGQAMLQNKVQLSTYGNHIGNNLADLCTFLNTRLKGVFGGVHLLPIYPSSGDGGFAPITYKEVNPEMGSWADVDAFAQNYDVTMELMVNHISPASAEFQDFLKHGSQSKFADMYIDWDKFWPGGNPTRNQLAAIRTRKPEAPVLTVTMADGSQRRVWCTFGAQQIDIDPFTEAGKQFLAENLAALSSRGVKMVRLDAFGYATKKPGTRCFMEEPECWELLEMLRSIGADTGLGLLCEVHEEYATNIELAKRGFWVYDFCLPLLMLHATNYRTAASLRNWLRICPRKQITVLDTHDGIGGDDADGLAQVVEVEELKQTITDKLGCGPNFKYFYRPDRGVYEASPHQYNCTYVSALRGNARLYLMCRAVQFFTPGIPMVYTVGLLFGKNDWANVKPEDGSSRGVNRHRYSMQEADEALEQPVVQALLRLCQFRNTHPAFNGDVEVPDAPEHILVVEWVNGPHRAKLVADFAASDFHTEVTQTDASQPHRMSMQQYSVESLDEGGNDGHHDGPRRLERKASFAEL